MVKVETTREWAEATGKSVEEIEAMIAEAESGSITREDLDPSTMNPPQLSPEAQIRAREFLRHAGYDV